MFNEILTIQQIKNLREKEDSVEFKEAKGGNVSYNAGNKPDPKKRRRCILGYVVALANEGGGHLVLGVREGTPNEIVGTEQARSNEGKLEGDIYRDLNIRVKCYELFENEKRVLVIAVPSRTIGKFHTFEDVPLMRAGEELTVMAQSMQQSILLEQESDFSSTIVDGLSLSDLDDGALEIMKRKYAEKQDNSEFRSLSTSQCLNDLGLSRDGKLTYAALILLGSETALKRILPQSEIRLEWRKLKEQIEFDRRSIFLGPFFKIIDEIWNTVDLRNGSIKIQDQGYIYDVPYFREKVIREGLHNAVAHRNYRLTSEILVKQSDTSLSITSPGGLPLGVELDNLLTVNSTPRNRLLTEIMEKTGLVERSGQGIDKIYSFTLIDGKAEPDYSKTDDYQVQLDLSGEINDKAFALFLKSEMEDIPDEKKLTVFDIIFLKRLKREQSIRMKIDGRIEKLLSLGLIEKRGKTRGTSFTLSQSYYEFTDQRGKYAVFSLDEQDVFVQILQYLQKFDFASMRDFIQLFEGRIGHGQTRRWINQFVENGLMEYEGETKGRRYKLSKNYQLLLDNVPDAIIRGFEEMSKEKEKIGKNSEEE